MFRNTEKCLLSVISDLTLEKIYQLPVGTYECWGGGGGGRLHYTHAVRNSYSKLHITPFGQGTGFEHMEKVSLQAL